MGQATAAVREVVAAEAGFQLPVSHPLDSETKALVGQAVELAGQI